MQSLYLIGLAGLAGLVATSPTLMAYNAPVGQLTVFTQDQFQGPSYKIELNAIHGHCYNLEAPVNRNLHSYIVSNSNCYFVDGDDCRGEVLARANALGTQVWGRIDLDKINDYSSRIGSVYCHNGHKDIGVMEAAATRGKKNVDFPPLDGPGEMIICEDTIDHGKCETLSANHACIPIPGGLSHDFHTIYQSAGSICRYYDTSCDEHWTLIINSHARSLFAELAQEVSRHIGFVSCQDQRSAPAVADVMESSHGPSNRSAVVLCKDRPDGGFMCTMSNTMNGCNAIQEGWAYEFDWLIQGPHTQCTFYASQNCSSIAAIDVVSGETANELRPIGGQGRSVGSLTCKTLETGHGLPIGAKTYDSLSIPREHSKGTPSAMKKRAMGDTMWIAPRNGPPRPGDVKVCNMHGLGGACTSFNAWKLCVALPQGETWKNVKSLVQEAGAICGYFQGEHDCTGMIVAVKSPYEPLRVDPVDFYVDDHVTRVYCDILGPGTTSAMEAEIKTLEASTTGVYLTKKPENSVQERSNHRVLIDSKLIICNSKDFKGTCLGYSQNEPCTRKGIGVRSLSVERGTQCIFFSEPNCKTDHNPPHYEGSNSDWTSVSDVGYVIESFKCRPAPFHRAEIV